MELFKDIVAEEVVVAIATNFPGDGRCANATPKNKKKRSRRVADAFSRSGADAIWLSRAKQLTLFQSIQPRD